MRIRSVRHLVSALALAAGLALFGGSAFAQSLFLPADSGASPAAVQAAVPQAIRSRLVRIDANMLARHVAPTNADTANDRVAQADRLDGVVRLNLFDDTISTFRRKNVKARPDGGFIWSGIVPGRPVHEALLLIRDGRISGRVQLGTRLFRIDPVEGGLHRVTEVNPGAYRPEAPPLRPPGVRGSPDEQPDVTPDATRAKTVIRVLVAYTIAAANEASSVAHNIKDEIDLAIAQANEAYDNGNIPIKLVLAGTMKTTYSEKADIHDDLNNLTSGGSLKPVRDQRHPNNADLVSLFRKSDPNFCGIAQLPGGGIMPMPSDATKGFAYSVIGRDCVTNLSFHHELGHNMGLQHDRYVYRLQTSDPNPGSQFYNFGYINKAENLRTVMAYRDGCPDPVNCARINWFSSATIRATGNVVIGKPKGDKNAADNTLRLRQTRSAISQYE